MPRVDETQTAPEPLRGRARTALLEAAVACIREKGYARTTQRDILEASGANPRSISYHFGSKDRLLAAGLVEAFRRRSEPVLGAAATGDASDPLGLFRASFLALLDEVKADRELAFALADGVAQARLPDLRPVFAEHYAEQRRLVETVVRAAFGPRLAAAGGDPAVLAAALLALFDGLVLQWLVDPASSPPPDELQRSLIAGFGLVAADAGESRSTPAGPG